MSQPQRSATAPVVLSASATLISIVALLFSTGIFDMGAPDSREFAAQARRYLLENGEVVVQAVQRMEERRLASEANAVETLVADRREEIFHDAAAPVGGNPNGDITLVEFFDYNCPYCRAAAPIIEQAEEADPGLRLVYKEYPILGPGSEFAARAALAAERQGKYETFHGAMMEHSGPINESSTMKIAEDVGLDIEKLEQDMADPAISAAIERNLSLARDLRITGTPSFVAGDQVVPGLVDLPTLQQIIADARAAADE